MCPVHQGVPISARVSPFHLGCPNYRGSTVALSLLPPIQPRPQALLHVHMRVMTLVQRSSLGTLHMHTEKSLGMRLPPIIIPNIYTCTSQVCSSMDCR